MNPRLAGWLNATLVGTLATLLGLAAGYPGWLQNLSAFLSAAYSF